MNFRIVSKTLGVLSCLIGLALALCWVYAYYDATSGGATELENSAMRALMIATLASFGLGIIQILAGFGTLNEVLRREAMVIVGLSWIEVGILGAIPYVFCDPGLNPVEAFFESVSGFTTTGSTVMTDIEAFPKAILLWRSVTQWLGGIGIIVVFVAVLSFLGVGSRSILQNESSLNISDAGRSRIQDVAFILLKVYLALSTLCFLGLLGLGMNSYEAVCHTMTTVATGGFSPKNNSIGHYENIWIEAWIAVFMFLSSISFMLYVFVMSRRTNRLKSEEEAKYYFLLTVVSCLAIAFDLHLVTDEHSYSYAEAFHEAFFNVISISTTTGFAVSDYDQWPLFSRMLLIILMLIGGCAGSTAGGVKMNRIILFAKISWRELVRSFRPNQVFRIKLNGTAPDEKVFVTTSFFIAMGFIIAGVSTLTVTLFEPSLDLLSSVGCVFGTLFNTGPGFEAVGPTDNFSILNPATQILLSFLMILGRLEFFALLVLFVPSLWRKY